MSAITLQPMVSSMDSVVADDELYEVIDGKRVRTPLMGALAVWTAFELARHLGNFAVANLGRAVTEMLFHLPAPINRDRRPDVAFVSYQRWAKTRPIPPATWDVVPNLAVEVVSPTDSAEELQVKIAEYFRAGVLLVWVVFPTHGKIHVYTPTQIALNSKNDVLDGGTVVPGFQLALSELFPHVEEPESANGSKGPSNP
jgi:Uma2 family endonuclease